MCIFPEGGIPKERCILERNLKMGLFAWQLNKDIENSTHVLLLIIKVCFLSEYFKGQTRNCTCKSA